MAPICYNERVKKVHSRFEIFFSLGNFIQCLLSVGIQSHFTQRDVYRKSSSQYFSVEVKHNLHIALMNNTPPNSFSVDFIHFKYRFQFGIQAQTRLMCGLLFFICLIFCFQLIVPQHYNYDINVGPIIWLPLFPVEQLYGNNQ